MVRPGHAALNRHPRGSRLVGSGFGIAPLLLQAGRAASAAASWGRAAASRPSTTAEARRRIQGGYVRCSAGRHRSTLETITASTVADTRRCAAAGAVNDAPCTPTAAAAAAATHGQ
jgi:hypothetical protein